MRIGFASTDWAVMTDPPSPGGAGWYRCALPARGLADLGEFTVHGRLVAKRSGEWCVKTWDGSLHDSLDVLVLQRWMHHETLIDMPRARAAGQRIVNDVDDWFWGLDQANRAFWSSHPKANPEENREWYAQIIAAGDAITCSTPYLADRLGRMFPHLPIVCLRNMIDMERYEDVKPNTSGQLIVGWVGATAWRSGDLETLRGILMQVLERADATFLHAGHADHGIPAADQLGLNGHPVRTKPMVPIFAYPRLFDGIDIGIVPLRDAPFNHAKSCIKGLEYAAAGVPFVAAELPEYTWLHDQQGIGRLARRGRDWIRELMTLVDEAERDDDRARNLAGAAAHAVEVRASDWQHAYARILSR